MNISDYFKVCLQLLLTFMILLLQLPLFVLKEIRNKFLTKSPNFSQTVNRYDNKKENDALKRFKKRDINSKVTEAKEIFFPHYLDQGKLKPSDLKTDSRSSFEGQLCCLSKCHVRDFNSKNPVRKIKQFSPLKSDKNKSKKLLDSYLLNDQLENENENPFRINEELWLKRVKNSTYSEDESKVVFSKNTTTFDTNTANARECTFLGDYNRRKDISVRNLSSDSSNSESYFKEYYEHEKSSTTSLQLRTSYSIFEEIKSIPQGENLNEKNYLKYLVAEINKITSKRNILDLKNNELVLREEFLNGGILDESPENSCLFSTDDSNLYIGDIERKDLIKYHYSPEILSVPFPINYSSDITKNQIALTNEKLQVSQLTRRHDITPERHNKRKDITKIHNPAEIPNAPFPIRDSSNITKNRIALANEKPDVSPLTRRLDHGLTNITSKRHIKRKDLTKIHYPENAFFHKSDNSNITTNQFSSANEKLDICQLTRTFDDGLTNITPVSDSIKDCEKIDEASPNDLNELTTSDLLFFTEESVSVNKKETPSEYTFSKTCQLSISGVSAETDEGSLKFIKVKETFRNTKSESILVPELSNFCPRASKSLSNKYLRNSSEIICKQVLSDLEEWAKVNMSHESSEEASVMSGISQTFREPPNSDSSSPDNSSSQNLEDEKDKTQLLIRKTPKDLSASFIEFGRNAETSVRRWYKEKKKKKPNIKVSVKKLRSKLNL